MFAPFTQVHSLALLGGGAGLPLFPLPHAEKKTAIMATNINRTMRDLIPSSISTNHHRRDSCSVRANVPLLTPTSAQPSQFPVRFSPTHAHLLSALSGIGPEVS
jgi:hypothetical protein